MGGKARSSKVVSIRMGNTLAGLIAGRAEAEGVSVNLMAKRLLQSALFGKYSKPYYPMPAYSCPAAIVAESEETCEQIAAPLGDCGWDVSERPVGTGIALQKQIYWRVDEGAARAGE